MSPTDNYFYMILHEKGMFYPLMARSEPIVPPFSLTLVRQTLVKDTRAASSCVHHSENYDEMLLQVLVYRQKFNCFQLTNLGILLCLEIFCMNVLNADFLLFHPDSMS